MTVAQLVVGWIGHSQSLIAHGLHSFSDLLSDFLVLYATRQSAQPADAAHPYGHARMETAATLALGVSLAGIGTAILVESGLNLQHMERVASVAWEAFWVAVATVVSKELLYRYLIKVAERWRSQLLTANALHTRADAASALVVVVGIGGALMGWRFLDLLAAAVMGFMILKMGAELAWGAMQELIDTGLDEQTVAAIRKTLKETPGVLGLHDIRTRKMAHQALVDAHVQVDARISVSEGHRIGEAARERVLASHPEVMDVLVHVDPENDREATLPPTALPVREDLQGELLPFLSGLPDPERVVLHYLGGRVEVEVFLPRGSLNADSLARAEQEIETRLQGHALFRAVNLNCLLAPK
ncbi:MAG: hypothetical protein RIR00_1392 [Pseudomonadota bacterium]